MKLQKLSRLTCAYVSVLALGAGAAAADKVTLQSLDGNLTVTGEIISFENSTYRIKTLIGEMTLDASRLTCVDGACPKQNSVLEDFRISGSTSINRTIMPELVKGYAENLKADLQSVKGDSRGAKINFADVDGGNEATVQIAFGGSTSGLRDLLNGQTDLSVTTRAARPDEASRFRGAGMGDLNAAGNENILALDALVVVTSVENPVRSISEEDAARVFAGEITNWSALGGPNQPIKLYLRPENTGTGALFSQILLEPRRLKLARGVEAMQSDEAVSSAVARDPFGIGFTKYSRMQNAKALSLRGPCGIQTPVNPFTIKTEEYPLSQRLYMYRSDKQIPAAAEKFMEYVRSEPAQEALLNLGYVDQSITDISLNEQGLRFAASMLPSDEDFDLESIQAMISEFLTAYRTSVTFRFEKGSSTLDTRAQSDIERLANIVASGRLKDKEILLIGFTDAVGRGDLNQSLSERRAEQVRQALLAKIPAGTFADQNIVVRGFGELSPLGCNTTLRGREINRRVEVWTRDIVASENR